MSGVCVTKIFLSSELCYCNDLKQLSQMGCLVSSLRFACGTPNPQDLTQNVTVFGDEVFI